MNDHPFRTPEASAPPRELTVEESLGVVIGAIKHLSDDEKENVLLAASRLYCLGVEFADETDRVIPLSDLRTVAEALRGNNE